MSGQEQDPTRDARIDEIRSKLERGDEPTDEERAYALSEGIELPTDEGGGPPPM